MSLIQNFKDRVPTEVLSNGAIRYETFDENGTSQGYVWIKRADEPSEAGNIWNKVVYDGLKDEIEARLEISAKASQQEAEAGVDDSKYITSLKLIQTLLNGYLPSKQLSVKQGTISHNSVIPQTSGYSNYLYFVSMNSFEGYNNGNGGASTTVCLKWQCDVDQSTRKVNARQKVYITDSANPTQWASWTGSSNKGTNISGTANYLELAWN